MIEAAAAGAVVTRNGKPVAVTPAMIRELPRDGVVALAKVFPVERIAKLFEELAEATCITNGGREIPDNRTRLAAAKYVADQVIGTPIQRQEIHQTVTNRTEDESMRLLESPAMRRAMREMLDRADRAENPPADH